MGATWYWPCCVFGVVVSKEYAKEQLKKKQEKEGECTRIWMLAPAAHSRMYDDGPLISDCFFVEGLSASAASLATITEYSNAHEGASFHVGIDQCSYLDGLFEED